MSVVKDTCQGCHFLGVGCEAHTCNNAFCENVFRLFSAAEHNVTGRGIQSPPKTPLDVTVQCCLCPIAQ